MIRRVLIDTVWAQVVLILALVDFMKDGLSGLWLFGIAILVGHIVMMHVLVETYRAHKQARDRVAP